MNKTTPWLATAISALAFGGAVQAAPSAPATAPAAPGPLGYDSAFTDYKPWQDVPPGNWRALNDALVAAPAGHGGHGPVPAPATAGATHATPAPARQAPAGEGGAHHMHGGHK